MSLGEMKGSGFASKYVVTKQGQIVGTPRDVASEIPIVQGSSKAVRDALNKSINAQMGAHLLSHGKAAALLTTVRAQLQVHAIKKELGGDVAKQVLPVLYGTQKTEVEALVAEKKEVADAMHTLQKGTIANIINTEKLKETTEKYVELHEKYVELQKEGGGGTFDWKQIGLYAVVAVAGLIGLSFLLKSIGRR